MVRSGRILNNGIWILRHIWWSDTFEIIIHSVAGQAVGKQEQRAQRQVTMRMQIIWMRTNEGINQRRTFSERYILKMTFNLGSNNT